MGDISAHFDRSEFACKDGCGFATVDSELLEILEIIRAKFDAPVKINSGCRCPVYNKLIGGSAKSKHMEGRAADIDVKGVPPGEVQEYFDSIFTDRYGLGKANTFTHVDSRSVKARWTY